MFQLSEVVPWGRNYNEYVAMFSLSETDLAGKILGCGDGPASFNAELTRRDGIMISADPIYAFSKEEIRQRIDETFAIVLDQTKKNMHEFVWKNFASVEDLAETRMNAMKDFLADYPRGKTEGRYRCEELPTLSFSNDEFSLALSSHFLFLYSSQLDYEFHVQAIREMCRVAREVRIFPVLQLGATPSPHLPRIIEQFQKEKYAIDVLTVNYEFQRGGNQMLRIRKIK
jgi:hypothetical protein